MKQVLFITDSEVSAMIWQGGQLLARYDFQKDYYSMAQLEEFLKESRGIETYVIVDVLEEEITLTTIPHVNSRERKFLSERTRQRLHRSSQFSYATVIGRMENLRRDDRLLVSGLTNDIVVLSWLDLLERQQVVLRGVYSLPLISNNMLKLIGRNKELTLLLSRQSEDYLRQSVFKNGKLIYSRNIPTTRQLSVQTVQGDLEKTRKYLQNQKLIEFDEKIDIVVLTSERFFKQLEGLDALITDMDLHYVKHHSLQQMLGVSAEGLIGGREIFSALLLKKPVNNHYGREQDLVVYKTKRNNRFINMATVISTLLLLMISVKLYLDIELLDKNIAGMQSQLVSLRSQNDKLNRDIEALPVKPTQMKTFVENQQSIERARKAGIDRSLARVSQVLMNYREIKLEAINWYINPAEYKQTQVATNRQRGKSQRKKQQVVAAVKAEDQFMEITASIDLAAVGNERALQMIDRFIQSLNKLDDVKQAVLIRKPVKDSDKVRVSGVMTDSVRENNAEFALTVQFSGAEHAG